MGSRRVFPVSAAVLATGSFLLGRGLSGGCVPSLPLPCCGPPLWAFLWRGQLVSIQHSLLPQGISALIRYYTTYIRCYSIVLITLQRSMCVSIHYSNDSRDLLSLDIRLNGIYFRQLFKILCLASGRVHAEQSRTAHASLPFGCLSVFL